MESRASLPLTALTSAVILGGLLLPFTPLGETLGLSPLPLSYFPWLTAILIGYCALGQFVKSWYARRYGYY